MVRISAHQPCYEPIWDLVSVFQDRKILELGTGTGVYGMEMARRGAKVTGIDISLSAIKFANNWAKADKVNFKGLVADCEDLPFPDKSFDVVFFGAMLHHFPDCTSPVREAVRVLKPGGKLILVEPNGYNPVVRFSRFLARKLPAKYADSIQATKNETIHTPRQYRKILLNLKLTGFKTRYISRKPAHLLNTSGSWLFTGPILMKKFALFLLSHIPVIGSQFIVISAARN